MLVCFSTLRLLAGAGKVDVFLPSCDNVNTTVLDSTYYPDMFREEEKAGNRLPPVCVYPRSPPFHSYITPQHASGLDFR